MWHVDQYEAGADHLGTIIGEITAASAQQCQGPGPCSGERVVGQFAQAEAKTQTPQPATPRPTEFADDGLDETVPRAGVRRK